MTVGERIKFARKEKKMTQQDLAEKVKLSRNFIAQIEIGTKIPSERTTQDISRELGVSEEWLRTGQGEMTPPVTRESEIAQITATLLQSKASDLELGLIKAYFELDSNLRSMLLEHFKSSLNLMGGNVRKEV